MFSASSYCDVVRSWACAKKAKHELGVGTRCTGHAARVCKKLPFGSFLNCRLAQSSPPCPWRGFLREARDGGVELLQGHQWQEHDASSGPMGKKGIHDLQARNSLEALLLQPGTSAPRNALASANLQAHVEVASLHQVQRIKRQLMQREFGNKVLGDVAAGLAHRAVMPAAMDVAWWCLEDVQFAANDKPVVTVVASTRPNH